MAIDLFYSYDFVIIRDHSLLIAWGGGVGRFWETTWFFRENGGGNQLSPTEYREGTIEN